MKNVNNAGESRRENKYIESQYGLVCDMPLFEAKDGFRMRAPWSEAEYLTQAGWKLVKKPQPITDHGTAIAGIN